MVSSLKKFGLFAVIALAFYSIGRFTGPTKVETKEVQKIVYQERQVKERERNTRETRLPDGTVIRETNSNVRVDTDRSTKSETSKETATTSRPNWRASGGYVPMIPGFQEPRYSIGLERQVISEIYAGITVTSDKTVGLSISIGF